MSSAEPPTPIVTIAICTRDRCASLGPTLETLHQQQLPPHVECELLVVDNGSSDGTSALLRAHAARHPRLRWMTHPQAGLANARNCMCQAARGDVLVWTDDDVLVPRDWAWKMAEPIVADRADATVGPVQFLPETLARIRGTLLERHMDYVASTAHFIDIHNPNTLVGANMAFHRRILDAVPSFDPLLGPGNERYGEEYLFSLQLTEAGFTIAGVPDAPVTHCFDLGRMTVQAMFRMAEMKAAQEAYLDWHWRGVTRKHPTFRLLRSRLSTLLKSAGGRSLAALSVDDQDRELSRRAWRAYWREYARQSLEPRKYRPESRCGAV